MIILFGGYHVPFKRYVCYLKCHQWIFNPEDNVITNEDIYIIGHSIGFYKAFIWCHKYNIKQKIIISLDHDDIYNVKEKIHIDNDIRDIYQQFQDLDKKNYDNCIVFRQLNKKTFLDNNLYKDVYFIQMIHIIHLKLVISKIKY